MVLNTTLTNTKSNTVHLKSPSRTKVELKWGEAASRECCAVWFWSKSYSAFLRVRQETASAVTTALNRHLTQRQGAAGRLLWDLQKRRPYFYAPLTFRTDPLQNWAPTDCPIDPGSTRIAPQPTQMGQVALGPFRVQQMQIGPGFHILGLNN